MANLAIGKKPLETIWTNPQTATDGIIDNYDSNTGFAFALFPANYTIKLGGVTEIYVIRFLLWDGVKKGAVYTDFRSRRFYKYELQLSEDGVNYTTWYDTLSNGYNGWQVFYFKEAVKAQYVRLVCKYHNENDQFHIVEFEIYDDVPSEPESWRLGYREKLSVPFKYDDTLSGLKTQQENLIKQFEIRLNEITRQKEVWDERIAAVTSSKQQFDVAVAQVELFNENLAFDKIADAHNRNSKLWAGMGVLGVLAFVCVVCVLFINPPSAIKSFIKIYEEVPKIFDSKNNPQINPTLYFEFAKVISLKILFLSAIGFMISFFFNNYRTEKHNYIINKHKALALAATIKLSEDFQADTKWAERGNLYNTAIKSLFQQPNSGYLTKDSDGVNFVNNISDKIK